MQRNKGKDFKKTVFLSTSELDRKDFLESNDASLKQQCDGQFLCDSCSPRITSLVVDQFHYKKKKKNHYRNNIGRCIQTKMIKIIITYMIKINHILLC